MNDRNRTDRILIAIALIILLLSGGMFYFDQWMWGGPHARGERIGLISSRKGDVRMKFEDDLKWQKASSGQDLAYNDAIYAGGGSQAELNVGESKMTVTENTLVVLRRDQNVNFLNLNYGTLFGSVAANEKFVVDTGNGKPVEITGNNTKIVLRRQNGKTQVDVTDGEATVNIDGKISKINKSSKFVIGDKTPAELAPNHLRALKPLHDQVITSDGPATIDFQWAWTNGRQAQPDDRYTLEFSGDPTLTKVHIAKNVQGALTTSMTVSQSLALYYHVRGPGGEVSPIEKVTFIRLEKPLIVQPLANAKIEAAPGANGMVHIEFQRPQNASVWYQLAADSNFTNILANVNTSDLRQVKDLPVGSYFLRARNDFGGSHTSAWSDVRPFDVVPRLEMMPLAQRHLPTRVFIPNKAYPRTLYMAPSEMVQSFLATHGFLRDFFAYKSSELDELKVQMGNDLFVRKDSAWPQQKLRPGSYSYRYQVSKSGFLPSDWSSQKSLEIVMEPPKPLGEATYGAANPVTGNREAEWNFTPLLFAKTYDLEVATTPTFNDALEFKTETAMAQTELPEGDYYWRVRARDRMGRIISPFSQPYKLKAMPQSVPQTLAQQASPRKPAQVGSSATKIVREREQAWDRSGWWAWLGTGENYVDYKQSLPGTGSLDSHNVKGGSQYFEAGFLAHNGLGGVISYKNTPGEFQPLQLSDGTEVPITPSTYRWTTLSLEALGKRQSGFDFLGSPIIYGMRAGVQQHHIPFLSLADDASVINLKNNEMTAASLGLLAEWTRSRWTYYWTMRYQFPLTSQADGASSFSLSPVFAFDGSIGTSYNITQQLKLGFFWYGQWHQMNFNYASDGNVANSGFQSLFYSNMDLRLGFDF